METGFKTSRIVSIATAVPDYKSSQDTILEFMDAAYRDPEASRKLKVLFHNSGIRNRYSVIPDFSDLAKPALFLPNHALPMVSERMDVYKQKALPLAIKAIRKAFENIESSINNFGITHLITVTCTGIYAPGIDAELLHELELSPDVFRIPINFVGCNAAFPAMRIADSIIKSQSDARVLIVCVEVCTIHFQPKSNSDNLLSNTIFGDGAAAMLIISNEIAIARKLKGFLLTGFLPLLLNRGKELMGWNITPINFEMILDANIPKFLGEEMEQLLAQVNEKLNLKPDTIDHWAVHPGGKKILDTVQRITKMEKLGNSYAILHNYGNMSSATILFVLNEIFNRNPGNGEFVLAMGFGPGLSIETASMVCYGFV
ncbi:MAG TPA: type III polyketide synthase [Lentimicrobium sp.]|nr:type III polyketide synthase [Lentimicrobium sp.]